MILLPLFFYSIPTNPILSTHQYSALTGAVSEPALNPTPQLDSTYRGAAERLQADGSEGQ